MSAAEGSGHSFAFAQLLVLLASAVLSVPIFRRLGLGSILGYLAAGVLIGPVLRFITAPEQIFQVSELGVVFFLFIVGLELKPAKLWAMRTDIFGLGLTQMVATGGALTLLMWLAGWRPSTAAIVGFSLAMSSTASGMQILGERNEVASPYGRRAVGILLFQDLAIVPLLAFVSLLSPLATTSGVSGLLSIVKIVGALAALLLAGRYLLNPMFRLLALTRAREIMTAAAILVVIGAAALMDWVGLSMAMGAFMAGVLLADSSFRHELEANIEPFRGLLLGLFFMAVGMSINVDSVLYGWWRIAIAVLVVMAVKAVILYGLNRAFRVAHNDAVRVALLLPQAGEFAFVVFASASAVRALWPSETALVAGVVTFSMALTPLFVLLTPYLLTREPEDTIEEDFEGAGGTVLVIGFGRFGQIVSQILLARRIDVTIIDASAERIRQAARFGFRIFFGDGTRRDVLRAAGAEQARIICVCVDQAQVTNQIVALIRESFPDARLHVRSWDRTHTVELLAKGVDYEIRETYESALSLGAATLLALDIADDDVTGTVADVRRRDAERLAQQRAGETATGDLTRPLEPEPLTPVRRALPNA